MVSKFIPAKRVRKFPKFWEEKWILDTRDVFFKQTKPPYIFIKTVNKDILMVWGELIKVKKK